MNNSVANPCCVKEMTDEQKREAISQIIESYHGCEGSLIQILHMVQSVYGCLPLSVQEQIARETNKPLSEVSGVVSFYSFFSTRPRGEHTIRVCLGTACYVRGGKKLVTRLEELLGISVGQTTDDRKFTFEVARCIGACGLAPAMMIDDVVYKNVNPNKLESILSKF